MADENLLGIAALIECSLDISLRSDVFFKMVDEVLLEIAALIEWSFNISLRSDVFFKMVDEILMEIAPLIEWRFDISICQLANGHPVTIWYICTKIAQTAYLTAMC